ncbi:hypothetical protein ISCGN_030382 [Ixodes scapularis]
MRRPFFLKFFSSLRFSRGSCAVTIFRYFAHGGLRKSRGGSMRTALTVSFVFVKLRAAFGLAMPHKCCVPGCRGNYETSSKKVYVLTFPEDEELRKVWVRAIPQKNLVLSMKKQLGHRRAGESLPFFKPPETGWTKHDDVSNTANHFIQFFLLLYNLNPKSSP